MICTRNMTLGELIATLEEVPADRSVQFDFGSFVPGSVDSYRGYYEQVAVSYEASGDVKVADFLPKLREAVDKTYTGYKGGEYTMTRSTPLWAANYSEATSTAIVGATDAGWTVVLHTAFMAW